MVKNGTRILTQDKTNKVKIKNKNLNFIKITMYLLICFDER